LQELLEDATAGDPITGLKWTHRSLRKICKALRRRGVRLAPSTLARLLRRLHFSMRTCRKQKAGIRHRDRERQFRYLIRLRDWYLRRQWPVISVDTKKKEWVGNFKNPGRCWRRRPRRVLDHDFPSWAEGRAIPVGIYDLAHNDGYVVIGVSHETPSFEVEAIRRWWLEVGGKRYATAQRLLIEADSGGANDHRKWEWKLALQRLADEFGLTITVTHFPPGASKWNPIDHRMFSLISANWAGEPLVSYEMMLKHIRTTRSDTGFHCRACVDWRAYVAIKNITAAQKATVRLHRQLLLPAWNYTIRPHGDRSIS
jgi:Rhodopirellula transposase DDE domain